MNFTPNVLSQSIVGTTELANVWISSASVKFMARTMPGQSLVGSGRRVDEDGIGVCATRFGEQALEIVEQLALVFEAQEGFGIAGVATVFLEGRAFEHGHFGAAFHGGDSGRHAGNAMSHHNNVKLTHVNGHLVLRFPDSFNFGNLKHAILARLRASR